MFLTNLLFFSPRIFFYHSFADSVSLHQGQACLTLNPFLNQIKSLHTR